MSSAKLWNRRPLETTPPGWHRAFGGSVHLLLTLLLAQAAQARPTKPTPEAIMEELAPPAIEMTLDRLDIILRAAGTQVTREGGYWELEIDGVRLACVTDARADRMRLLTPIVEVANLPDGALHILLEANWHTALDGRYAINQGVVYATFIHPLSSLTEAEAKSALRQVASLQRTFGSSFSSGELSFGIPMGEPIEE